MFELPVETVIEGFVAGLSFWLIAYGSNRVWLYFRSFFN